MAMRLSAISPHQLRLTASRAYLPCAPCVTPSRSVSHWVLLLFLVSWCLPFLRRGPSFLLLSFDSYTASHVYKLISATQHKRSLPSKELHHIHHTHPPLPLLSLLHAVLFEIASIQLIMSLNEIQYE